MRRVTFRKVYGYRDPHNGVREVPPSRPSDVEHWGTLYRGSDPTTGYTVAIYYDANTGTYHHLDAQAAERIQQRFNEQWQNIHRMWGPPPNPDQEADQNEELHWQRERSAKRRPVTKRSIAQAFGLTAAGEQKQLQNILDKVKKHL